MGQTVWRDLFRKLHLMMNQGVRALITGVGQTSQQQCGRCLERKAR